MCFSKEVSLMTYIIGLMGSKLLYDKGYEIEAVFYGWVIHMQLIEFFLWKYQPCSQYVQQNNQVTKTGLIVNHLEPTILWLAILYFSKLPFQMNWFMIIFSILTVLYLKQGYHKTHCTTVAEDTKPHLNWEWNRYKYYYPYYFLFLISLLMLFYTGLPGRRGKINAAVLLASFMLSYVIYKGKNVVGSMWCFFVILAPYCVLYLDK